MRAPSDGPGSVAAPKRRPMWILAVGTVFLLVGSGAGFGVATAATSGVAPHTKDVLRRNLQPALLSPQGGVRVTVESVTLPAGHWVLSSKESLVNFGPSDYVRCAIVAGSGDINGATSLVGDTAQPGNQGPGALVATVENLGSIDLTKPTVISVQCDHDTTGAQPYVDADSALWAHRSRNIDNLGV
jgi:hypothetical protein